MRELNEVEIQNVSGGFFCCYIIKKIVNNLCPRPSYPNQPSKPSKPNPPTIPGERPTY